MRYHPIIMLAGMVAACAWLHIAATTVWHTIREEVRRHGSTHQS